MKITDMIFLSCFFIASFLISGHSSAKNNRGSSSKHKDEGDHSLKDNEYKRSCRHGQAIKSLTWQPQSNGTLHVFITCVNVTSSCKEKCEWRPVCSREVDNFQYVQGVVAFYDNLKDTYRSAFLCCKADRDGPEQCSAPFKPVTTSASGKKGCSDKGDAKECNEKTKGDGKSEGNCYYSGAMEKKGEPYAQVCCTVRQNDTLCPIREVERKHGANYGLFALFGLLGLAGLGGVALAKLAATGCLGQIFCCSTFSASGSLCVSGCPFLAQSLGYKGAYMAFASSCGGDGCCVTA